MGYDAVDLLLIGCHLGVLVDCDDLPGQLYLPHCYDLFPTQRMSSQLQKIRLVQHCLHNRVYIIQQELRLSHHPDEQPIQMFI